MLARNYYSLSLQSKSLIIELTTNQKVNGRYFCDYTIYESLAEAERNPQCLKVTLLQYIESVIIEPRYLKADRTTSA